MQHPDPVQEYIKQHLLWYQQAALSDQTGYTRYQSTEEIASAFPQYVEKQEEVFIFRKKVNPAKHIPWLMAILFLSAFWIIPKINYNNQFGFILIGLWVLVLFSMYYLYKRPQSTPVFSIDKSGIRIHLENINIDWNRVLLTYIKTYYHETAQYQLEIHFQEAGGRFNRTLVDITQLNYTPEKAAFLIEYFRNHQ